MSHIPQDLLWQRWLADDLQAKVIRLRAAEAALDEAQQRSDHYYKRALVPDGTESRKKIAELEAALLEAQKGKDGTNWFPESFVIQLQQQVTQQAATICQLQRERDAWEESAAQFCRNETYYRGLVERVGEVVSEKARACDDGSISESILCAKVPELIEAEVKSLRKTINRLAGGSVKGLVAHHRVPLMERIEKLTYIVRELLEQDPQEVDDADFMRLQNMADAALASISKETK